MTLSRLRQARYAILGFGCNQAFLFAMLYLGSYNEGEGHGFLLDRADLLRAGVYGAHVRAYGPFAASPNADVPRR